MIDVMAVIGVDACAPGWVGMILDEGRAPEAIFGRTIAHIATQAPQVVVIAIDIPIGLPAEGRRAADVEARRVLGPRWQSLFMTPVAEALHASTYLDANDVSRRRTGAGISRQAYALRAKILEVAAWIETAPAPVFEVHPELSFSIMNGRPMTYPKKRWAGFWERLSVLRANGIDVPTELREAGTHAAPDDVLDAAAAAWTARRLATDSAVSFPGPPEHDECGRSVAIWA